MAPNETTTTDDSKQITATVAVDDVVFALQMNATHGADDRVIAVPQRDGAVASVRRAFSGSERYSDPQNAPVHIRPEALVEDGFERPPRRDQVDTAHMNVPELVEDRDEADEAAIDDAHDELTDVWEIDVRGMIGGDHEFEQKGCQITLIGIEDL